MGGKILYTGSNREEWLRLRAEGLGASDIPVITGHNPYTSPVERYLRKLGLHDGPETNGPMQRGHDCEDIIAKKLQEDEDFQLEFPGGLVFPDQRLVASTERPFIRATQDAFHESHKGKMLDEFKCPNRAYPEEGVICIGMSDAIWVQLQAQMYVAEEDRILLAVLPALTWQLYWVLVDRNQDFIEQVMLPACDRFWQHIQDKTPPSVVGRDDEIAALASAYAPQDGSTVELHADLIESVDRWGVIDTEVDRLDQERKLITSTIREAIGTAQAGKLPDGRVITNKESKNGRRTLRRKF